MKHNAYRIVSQVIDENIGYLPDSKPGQSTVIRPVGKVVGGVKGAIAGGLVAGPLGVIGGAVGGAKMGGAIGSGVSRGLHSVKPLAKQALATPDHMANKVIPQAYQYQSPGVM